MKLKKEARLNKSLKVWKYSRWCSCWCCLMGLICRPMADWYRPMDPPRVYIESNRVTSEVRVIRGARRHRCHPWTGPWHSHSFIFSYIFFRDKVHHICTTNYSISPTYFRFSQHPTYVDQKEKVWGWYKLGVALFRCHGFTWHTF